MKTIVRILTTAVAVMMFVNFVSAQQHLCETATTNNYEATTLLTGSSVLWTLTDGTGSGAVLSDDDQTICEIDWTAATAGTYTLTLREIHSSTLCWEEVTLQIIIHERPVANFALTGSTVCNGEDAEVLVNITSTADWTLNFEIDGTPGSYSGVVAEATYDFAPVGVAADMQFEIISISNLGCSAGDGIIGANNTHDLEVAILAPTITPL